MRSRRFFCFFLALVFLAPNPVFSADVIDIVVDVRRDVAPSEMVEVFGVDSEGRRVTLTSSSLKRGKIKLGRFQKSQLRGAGVVLFVSWDKDETVLVPWFRDNIRWDLARVSIITVVVEDDAVLEYN